MKNLTRMMAEAALDQKLTNVKNRLIEVAGVDQFEGEKSAMGSLSGPAAARGMLAIGPVSPGEDDEINNGENGNRIYRDQDFIYSLRKLEDFQNIDIHDDRFRRVAPVEGQYALCESIVNRYMDAVIQNAVLKKASRGTFNLDQYVEREKGEFNRAIRTMGGNSNSNLSKSVEPIVELVELLVNQHFSSREGGHGR